MLRLPANDPNATIQFQDVLEIKTNFKQVQEYERGLKIGHGVLQRALIYGAQPVNLWVEDIQTLTHSM